MAITASQAREQLFPLIEQVNLDSTSVVITSKKGNAVLISESEWESILESMALGGAVGLVDTYYLFSALFMGSLVAKTYFQ
jgi:prevent-host-death family protein